MSEFTDNVSFHGYFIDMILVDEVEFEFCSKN